VLGSVALRKTTCGFPVALCIYPYKVVGQHDEGSSVRPMVLPCWAAGSWGFRFAAARIKLLRWSGAVFSFGVHRFDLIPTIVVIASLLLAITMIWAY
jgi:hypothetical protein